MSKLIEAIAGAILLILSAGYLVFVAWASDRRRDEAEAERLAPRTKPDPEPRSDEAPKHEALKH